MSKPYLRENVSFKLAGGIRLSESLHGIIQSHCSRSLYRVQAIECGNGRRWTEHVR